jgi:hypothetical protein
VLRPAALPPSGFTYPAIGTLPASAYTWFNNPALPFWPLSADLISTPFMPPAGGWPAWWTPTAPAWPKPWTDTNQTSYYVQDPGVKNPFLFAANQPVQPPPVPPRRLFQISDFYGSGRGYTISNGLAGPYSGDFPSNAATVYFNNDNYYSTTYSTVQNPIPANPNAGNVRFSGDPRINTQIRDNMNVPSLANPMADLTSVPTTAIDTMGNVNVDPFTQKYLGFPAGDHRDVPYFRSEWLQKVMNLTTVRTHQYAVWITVGFFEVTQVGDPQLAVTDPTRAYDQLGLEIGALDGRNTRYRSFFLVDRTKADGFNPYLPGNFRDCVLYRQTIE